MSRQAIFYKILHFFFKFLRGKIRYRAIKKAFKTLFGFKKVLKIDGATSILMKDYLDILIDLLVN